MGIYELIVNNMDNEKQSNIEGGYVNRTVDADEVWRYLLGELNDGDINPFTDRGLEEPENLVEYAKENIVDRLLHKIEAGYMSSETLEDNPLGYIKVAMVIVGSEIVRASINVNNLEDKNGDVFVTEEALNTIIDSFTTLVKGRYYELIQYIVAKNV